jgi:hypothetical protein
MAFSFGKPGTGKNTSLSGGFCDISKQRQRGGKAHFGSGSRYTILGVTSVSAYPV